MSDRNHTSDYVPEDENIRNESEKAHIHATQNGSPELPLQNSEPGSGQPLPGTARTVLTVLQKITGELLARMEGVTPELRGSVSKLLDRWYSLKHRRDEIAAELEEKRARLKKEEELPHERTLLNRLYVGLTTAALIVSGVAALGIGASFVRDYYGDPTLWRGLLYASPIPLMGFVFKQLAFSLWPPGSSRRVQVVLLIAAVAATGVFLYSFSQRYARDLDAEFTTGSFSVSSAPAESGTAGVADNFRQIFLGQTLSEVVAATVLYWTFTLLIVPQTGPRWRYFRRAIDRLEGKLDETEDKLAELNAELTAEEGRIKEAEAAESVLHGVLRSLTASLSKNPSKPQP